MADLEMKKNGAIATLTMNRPAVRNALSMDMRAELDEALHEVEFDEKIRCVILTGAGDHFMAGGDIAQMNGYLENHEGAEVKKYFLHRIHNLHPIMFSMRRMAKPIIAKVRGAAAGAGAASAAGCVHCEPGPEQDAGAAGGGPCVPEQAQDADGTVGPLGHASEDGDCAKIAAGTG